MINFKAIQHTKLDNISEVIRNYKYYYLYFTLDKLVELQKIAENLRKEKIDKPIYIYILIKKNKEDFLNYYNSISVNKLVEGIKDVIILKLDYSGHLDESFSPQCCNNTTNKSKNIYTLNTYENKCDREVLSDFFKLSKFYDCLDENIKKKLVEKQMYVVDNNTEDLSVLKDYIENNSNENFLANSLLFDNIPVENKNRIAEYEKPKTYHFCFNSS